MTPTSESSSSALQPAPESGTPMSRAVGQAMQALSRAARSFVLYDPQNALVRTMLEAFRDRTMQAVAVCGELALDVAPFEISMRGEVAYQDADREKSLAFKLYRDGVRRLTIRPSVTIGELLRLMEIIALRYAAMRQDEDDTVTLLRKAELQHIEVVAVVGFAPAEELPEDDAPSEAFAGVIIEPPPDFDTPLPRLPAPGRVAYHELPEPVLEALREFEADSFWATSALATARALVREAASAQWPASELVPFFVELRDAMVADAAFGPLLALLAMLETERATEVRAEVVKGLAKPEALDAVIDAVPVESTAIPAELVQLLPFLGGGVAMDRLIAEKDPRRSAVLLELMLASASTSVEALVAKLPQLEPQQLHTIGKSLAAKSPKLALEVYRLLMARPDLPAKLEALTILGATQGDGVATTLLMQLDAPVPEVRLKAIEVVQRRGDPAAATRLVQLLENKERPLPEVEALGRALAVVSPVVAAKNFLTWAHPVVKPPAGLTPQQRRLQWAAVAGMGAVKSAVAEKQLQAVFDRATDDALKKHCQAALANHRKADANG